MQRAAQAQPNIALIKYWGKRDAERNLPAVGSLSLTLDALDTRMVVEPGAAEDSLEIDGRPAPDMLPRVTRCLDRVAGPERTPAHVSSTSNFPLGAGLASSASAFAALVVAAAAAYGRTLDTQELARLAGAASGSAARSLYGGFVRLDAGDSDIGLKPLAAPDAWPLQLVIAITEEAPKPVGSTEAMQRSAATSPFYRSWIEQQDADLDCAEAAVAARDFGALAEIAEHNCLKMHSVTWSARPPVVYWNRATLACLQAVRRLQADGVDVFFTIDAGPQLKAVCTADAATDVRAALAATDGVQRLMETGLGEGARLVNGR